jgi:hypothetical protein
MSVPVRLRAMVCLLSFCRGRDDEQAEPLGRELRVGFKATKARAQEKASLFGVRSFTVGGHGGLEVSGCSDTLLMFDSGCSGLDHGVRSVSALAGPAFIRS